VFSKSSENKVLYARNLFGSDDLYIKITSIKTL